MKISKETLDIIKNCSKINLNLLIKKDTNQIKTISHMKNILMSAKIKEKFDKDLLFSDCDYFLKLITSLSDPEIILNEKNRFFFIKDKETSIKFYNSDKKILVTPRKLISLPDKSFKFKLSKKHLDKIILLSKKSYSPDILFIANGENIKCVITDRKRGGSEDFDNYGSIEFTIGKTKDKYTAFFKTENFKMMSDDYDVVISKQKVSHFINRNKKIEYWVALEPSSELSDKISIDSVHNIDSKIEKLYQQRDEILNDREIYQKWSKT